MKVDAPMHRRSTDGAGWHRRAGVSTFARSIERAAREIDGGLVAGFDRLLSVTEHLSAAGSWPSFVHPRLGSGSGGLGDDPLVCARFVEALREPRGDRGRRASRVAPVAAVARRLARSVDRRGAGTDLRRNAGVLGALARSATRRCCGNSTHRSTARCDFGAGAVARVVEHCPIGRGSPRATRAMRQ